MISQPAISLQSDAPNYLLRLENRSLGPAKVQQRSGQECIAYYGFSDKSSYDRFQGNCSLKLTPYPLVDVFLQEQSKASDRLNLIVMNPSGPDAESWNAVTMKSVLAFRKKQLTELMSTHVLTFDKKATVYWVDEVVLEASGD